MSKTKKQAAPTKKKTPLKTSSKVIYTAVVIVILIPLALLAYIYFGAKENSGKPVIGSRFDDSLTTEITTAQVEQVKSAMTMSGIESVEVNLKSATLRINIDTSDDISEDEVTSIMNDAYDKVNAILPVSTYFTNKDAGTKMYDLDINVYNYVVDDTHTKDGWIYKELVKNAANTEVVRDTLSSPRNEDLSEELQEQQNKLNNK